MEETKPNILNQFITALVLPHEYHSIFRQKKGKLALFVTLALLLLTFFSGPLQLITTLSSSSKIQDIVDEHVPDFEFSNGTLMLSEDYKLDEDDVFVYASSSIDSVSADDVLDMAEESGYKTIMIFTSKNCIVYSRHKLESYNYSQFSALTFNKSQFMSLVSYLSVFLSVLVVFILIGYAIGYLICALLYALLGMIIQQFLGIPEKLTFGQLFSLCLCAKLPLFILRRIFDIIGVNLFIPFRLGILLTIIYITIALVSIKKHYIPVQTWNQPQGFNPYQSYPNNQNYQQNPSQYQNNNYFDTYSTQAPQNQTQNVDQDDYKQN